MDINMAPDGSVTSIAIGYDSLLALLVIAIPAYFLWWWILKKRAKPNKPKMIHIAGFTILSAIIIYVIIIVTAILAVNYLYTE